MEAEYPKVNSSEQKKIFWVRFPAYQSEYYYEPVAAEIDNSSISFLNHTNNTVMASSLTQTMPDIETSFNNISVQIRKQSGCISMMRMRQNSIKEKVLDIKFNSIYEVDDAGNKVRLCYWSFLKFGFYFVIPNIFTISLDQGKWALF